MLAEPENWSSLTMADVLQFKQAIEQEHNVKITLVSGGSVVRSDGTYVLRGALAASRLFANFADRVAQGWAEAPAYLPNANAVACHRAVEDCGKVLNEIDNHAW